jgi:DNA-binding response OmpR family regulator
VQERKIATNGLASQFREVLVVSGDLSLSQFLSEGLTESGFWMSVVRSGLQALEVFRLRGFDALIIDAAVSDLPMDELIRRLRSDPDKGSESTRQSVTTPMVVIAGMTGELEPYDIDALDLHAVFVAPFELEDLASSLKSLPRRDEA